MTTPHQPAPAGAFVVGGGEFNYGQDYDDGIVRGLFAIPAPTLGNAIDLLRDTLLKLPLEALQFFKDLIPDVVENVFNTVTGAVDAIMNALTNNPVFLALVDFQQWVIDFFQSLGSGLVSGDLSDFGEWFDGNIVQPIIGTVDGFIRGVLGVIGGGFNVSIVEDTAKSLADAVASLNGAITRLDRESDAGRFNGTAVSVDFSNVADSSSLGGSWDQVYPSGSGTGTLGVSDGRAKFSGSATNRRCIARYSLEAATSDYQKVGAAYATLPSHNFLGSWKSWNTLHCRMNDAEDTFVYLDLSANSFELGCYVSGSKTVFHTESSFKFKPGTAYWLEAGTTGGLRIFRVWAGTKVILTYTDAALVSQVGHLYCGKGVQAYSSTYLPAEVSAWAFFDNTPAVVAGTGWRVMRTDTSEGDFSSGSNLFDASWFDTVDYISDDLASHYSIANNRVTIQTDGWYLINVVQWGEAGLAPGTGGPQRAALYVNGVVAQYSAPHPGNLNTNYVGFDGSFAAYLEAGDEVQPGYHSSYSDNDLFRANAGGSATYWSGVFLGNKRAT